MESSKKIKKGQVTIPDASTTVKGIAKLYTSLGTNTDGSVDQDTLNTNFNLKAPLASPTFTGTVNGITSSMVGLGNVDNTSDVNKPVSTAQAAADAVVLASANSHSDGLITQLINGAPADADTLKELNDKIVALQAIVGGSTADGDSIVNTVSELLAVFSTYSEGVDIVNLVGGKVSATDIYNALDSIVSGKVLDSRQGKVLMDAIVALQNGKVDKVAGERLINAAEITKLAGLGNIVTTIKPILSTALASQNVAGMVTYINALNPVLVVAGSEIVKYTTTDTGRVFQLNLRGRSFGVGQPAIVAADVLEVTEFLNKDLKLSNYPNTRNDGQLPTNKVLSTDANGNLKMYTIATSPAPYLEVLVPDSTLPSTTTNFTLKGAFFTPTMTVSIVGQTINYITFKSDNLVLVNVTTGAAEGSYAVTLNNGISATFNSALLIVLGTVFTPEIANWVNIVQPIDVQKGQALLKTANSVGTAELNFLLDRTKKYSMYFNITKSPLITATGGQKYTTMSLLDTVNGDVYDFLIYYFDSSNEYEVRKNGVNLSGTIGWHGGFSENIRFYWNMTQMYIYRGTGLMYTFTAGTFPNIVKAKFTVQQFDNTGIKYVEHF